MLPSLASLAADLAAGRTTSRRLVDDALARIADPGGEGGTCFVAVDGEAARAQADASDALRGHGIVPSPLAGIPISAKDLFDLAGQVTTAGSAVLRGAPPAAADAPAMARLRAAGAVIVGRTNMTEFAFSGVGLNPHYGTPRNPFDRDPADRARGRIPGGSSSGAAVSVTDGMAAAAIGTDTGGSVRIPSAFCGLTGFKPTQRRIPLDGAYPLSANFDSIGPLAPRVACCALLDAVMAGQAPRDPAPRPAATLRLGVPQSVVLDDLDAEVARAFEAALTSLGDAGVGLVDLPLPELAEIVRVNGAGGLITADAYAIHRHLLESAGDGYDPRVRTRILRGREQSAADYIDVLNARRDLCRRADAATAAVDALVLPTVPMVAPFIDDLRQDDGYARLNVRALRNTNLFNFLDRCAVSLPCQAPGDLPVGLMLVGPTGGDQGLLAVAAGVEAILAGR
ncbi:MAG: amidase [Hyphomicrobiales bacterium]|nr:amidase [Hyphomicrobiales bacterium]